MTKADEALLPPTPTANNVNFRDVAPGVGPFDYPVKGIDLIANDLEAEALWAVVEFNNMIARVYESGSTAGVPSWNTLQRLELLHPGFVGDVDALVELDRRKFGEDSALTELVVERGANYLALTVCYQHSFEVRDASGETIESGANTTARKYTFEAIGPARVQLTGFSLDPVDQEKIVSCDF